MGYLIQKLSSSRPLLFLLVQSSDHITGLTGASPTVTLSKNGGAFASPAGAVSEIGNGWYKVAPNATDSTTFGPLVLHATAASADPCDDRFEVVAFNPDGIDQQGSLPSIQGIASLLRNGNKVLFVSPAGNNSNTGLDPSPSGAKLTIASAMASATIGSVVETTPGTYAEQVSLPVGVKLHTEFGSTVAPSTGYSVTLSGANKVTGEGLLIAGAGSFGCITTQGLGPNIVDGVSMSQPNDYPMGDVTGDNAWFTTFRNIEAFSTGNLDFTQWFNTDNPYQLAIIDSVFSLTNATGSGGHAAPAQAVIGFGAGNESMPTYVGGIGGIGIIGPVLSVESGGITAASFAANSITASALAADAAQEIATALLDLANGVETSITVRQALRAMASALAGNVTGAGTGAELFKALGNSGTTRISNAGDTSGNRTITATL